MASHRYTKTQYEPKLHQTKQYKRNRVHDVDPEFKYVGTDHDDQERGSSMSSPLYAHLSTRESRTLVIHAAQGTDDIQCSLETFNLDAPPTYEALSYTWAITEQDGEKPIALPADCDPTSSSRSDTPLPTETLFDSPDRSEDEERAFSDLFQRYKSQFLAAAPGAPSSASGPQKTNSSRPQPDIHTKWDSITAKRPWLRGSILINGFRVKVAENLELALHHLRRPVSNRRLWVDALCINQHDTNERGHQVARMSQIYRSATSVCVWLGPPANHSDEAIEFVRTLREVVSTSDSSLDEEWSHFFQQFIPHGYPSPELMLQFKAFSFLIDRPYFYRRWVVQEIALTSKVVIQCGHSTLDWQDLAAAAAFFNTHHERLTRKINVYYDWDGWLSAPDHSGVSGNIRATAAMQFCRFMTEDRYAGRRKNKEDSRSSLLTAAPQMDIVDLVIHFSYLRASDPRDTIYALLSLAKESGPSSLPEPDYSKPAAEIMHDFVAYGIETKKSLDFLCRYWAPNIQGLPSWIKTRYSDEDLSEALPEISGASYDADEWLFEQGPVSAYAPYSASYGRCADARRGSKDESLLIVRGFIITEILEVSSISDSGLLAGRWTSQTPHVSTSATYSLLNLDIQEYEDQEALPALATATRIHNPYGSWTVLMGGRAPKGGPLRPSHGDICRALFQGSSDSPPIESILKVYEGTLRATEGASKELLSQLSCHEDVYPVLQRIHTCTRNRRYMFTKDRRYGLAPFAAEAGDVACILFGCTVPVILRPVGPRFKFVGAAYLAGVMEGQAIRELEKGKYTEREFGLI